MRGWMGNPFAVLGVIGLIVIGSTAGVALSHPQQTNETAAVTEPVRLTAVDAEDFDTRANSGTTFWQGQRLLFNGSVIVPNVESASQSDRTFQVRRLSDDGDIRGLVTEFVVDTDGEYAIRTAGLDDEYVITYDGDPVYIQNGVGYRSSPPDGTTVTTENSKWEVATQNLRARWDEQEIDRDDTVDLEFSSNRASYQVEVSARGLDFNDLTDIFPQSAFASDFDAEEDDDILILRIDGDATITADFEDIDPGVYGFQFQVTDSTAISTATITVGQDRGRVGLDDSVIRQEAGDIAEFDITMRRTDRAYLIIGGSDVNFLDVIRLTDSNDDGEITVRMNTRYAGMNPDDPGVSDTVDPYTAESGRVTVYDGDDSLASGESLDDVRDALDITTTGLSQPLQPANYEVVIADSDDISTSRDRLVIPDEQDVASLSLETPGTGGVSTFVAPGSASTSDLDDLKEDLTRSGVVQEGSLAVVRIDTSGVFGYLDEADDDVSVLVDNEDEGLDLRIEQVASSTNRRDARIDLTQGAVSLLPDPDENALYVTLNTRTLTFPRELRSNQEIEVEFTLTGVDSDFREYDAKAANHLAYQGYPYLRPGRERSAMTTFRIIEPSVRINDLTGGQLAIPPETSVMITGSSNLAAGSELTVRLQGRSGVPLADSTTATVQTDGTWSATFDFSEAAIDDRFELTVRHRGETLTTVDGRVVQAATPTPEPTPAETPAPTATPSPTPTPTPEPTPEPTPTQTAEPTVTATPSPTETGGQPGFGIAIAVVAIVVAAILARLRSRSSS